MRQIFANLATAEIASAVGTADTTISVTDASGLPAPGADEYWVGVLYAGSGGVESGHEIVHVTGISTNTLTVTRGQEGTTAATFAAGDSIELRNTAGTLERIQTTETVHAAASGALDRANGGIQTYTLTANETVSVAINEGQSLKLHLSAGATYTVTWPTMTWAGGSAPTLTASDVIEFWKVGTTLYGAYVGSVA